MVAVVAVWNFGKLTLISVVIAFGTTLLAQTICAAIVARTVIGGHSKPDGSLLRPLYSYGAKVWLSSVPQIVTISVDQLFLSVVPTVAPAQLGNYAVAASLSWLALPASTAFGSVALPRIARVAGSASTLRIERPSLLGAVLTAVLTIGLISLLAPFSGPPPLVSRHRHSVLS